MSYAGAIAVKKFGTTAQTNTTPPTFGGITSATASTDGSILAAWSLATGSAATPIRYVVYCALGASVPAASLFVGANIVGEARSTWTSLRFFQLGDQSTYLVNGQSYTVGVRAFSAVNVFETNTVTLNVTAVATANLPSTLQTTATQLALVQTQLAADHANFATDHTNFQADHTNFAADHTNFQADIAALVAANTVFSGYLVTLNSYLGSLATSLTTLDGLNDVYSAQNTALSLNLSTLSTQLSTLAADLVTFADNNADFAANNQTLADSTAGLADSIATLAGLVTALAVSISGIGGGLEMTIQSPILTMVIETEEVIP